MRYLTFLLFIFPWVSSAQNRSRLPDPINTSKSIEYAPSITADGKTMVYQSDQYGIYVNASKGVPNINADGKSGGILDEYETKFFGIYEVKLHPTGEWMTPQNIAPINLYANENLTPIMGGPSISYDGNTLFFFANFGKNGYGREDIYISERKKDTWTKPKNLGSNINSDNYEGFPSVSPDGKRLYFTREILGKIVEGKQCYRIMVSEKARNGKWRTPYELPEPINGVCEKAPRILADGKTMVFSSIRKGGRGDFDLYKSILQENGSWSEPVNLEFVNTKKSDQFVSVSPCGDLMYYVSNGDIYTTEIPESLRPIRSATIQGYVIDSISKQPIKAKVVVREKESGQTIAVLDNNPSDGRFTAIVPFGKAYELSVNLPAFFTNSHEIDQELLIDCEPIPLNFNLLKIPTTTEEKIQLATNNPNRFSTPTGNTPNKPVDQTELNNESQTYSEKILAANPISEKAISENNTPPQAEETQAVIVKEQAPEYVPRKKEVAQAPIEELELIADSQETESEKISAEGEKREGAKFVTTYALILRIVDKETSQFINNPDFKLTGENNKALEQSPILNGNEHILKVNEGDKFSLQINANGYLQFNAQIPPMNSDKRVTVKLAPKLPSVLNIALLDAENGQPLSGEILLISQTKKDTITSTITNGELEIPLKENDKITVIGKAKNYFDLSESVDIDLPENGNKIIDLKLKLTLDEYTLELLASDLETGNAIPNAVFYVFDENDQRVLQLISDADGKAVGKLNKNGKYRIQLLADSYQTSEQTLNNLLQNTQVLFKSIPAKINKHEIKVLFFDRLTEEEMYPQVKVNNESKGNAPFFIQGQEGDKFEISITGENIKPESYNLTFGDELMTRVSTNLLAQKNAYDFYFRVIDKNNNKILPRAAFKITDLKSKRTIQEFDNGQFLAYIEPGKEYVLQVEEPGFEPISQRFAGLEWIKSAEFERDIYLIEDKSNSLAANADDENTPEVIKSETFGDITRGKKITLENIYFDQSSPVLRDESFAQLDELAKILQENKGVKIEVRGHTDNGGDFFLNVKLSKDRCQSVIEYLTKKGISKDRLTPVGRGPIEPVAPNDTEENRKKNRRVEFMVL